jgi:hypothetical protein
MFLVLFCGQKTSYKSGQPCPKRYKKSLVFYKPTSFLEEFYTIQSQSLALQKLLKMQGYSEKITKK